MQWACRDYDYCDLLFAMSEGLALNDQHLHDLADDWLPAEPHAFLPGWKERCEWGHLTYLNEDTHGRLAQVFQERRQAQA